jgi:hypothetical protein
MLCRNSRKAPGYKLTEYQVYCRPVRKHCTKEVLLLALIPALLVGCPREVGTRQDAAGPKQQEKKPGERPEEKWIPSLKISDVSFAGPAGHRATGDFSRGETVLCLFTVTSFTYKKGKGHITVDLQVSGPQDQIVLQQRGMELLKGAAPSVRPGTLRTAASLAITAAAPPGRYKVRLKVKDRLGQRTGTGTGTFTLLGQPVAPSKTLTLGGLRAAGDVKVPAGAVVPVAFELRGFSTRQKSPQQYELDLGVETVVEDSAGQVVKKGNETLLRKNLLFAPSSYPFEHAVVLPRDLSPGAYRVVLRVADRVGGGKTMGLLRINVVPTTYGVYNLHTHDAAGLPRDTFQLGEQIYVRLSVIGLKVKQGKINASVDLAVGGPGGVYMASKGAAVSTGQTALVAARVGRYPVQLPLVLPALSYTGKYQIVIRAHDHNAGKVIVREHKIKLEGTAPKPLATFKVDNLEARYRPDLPQLKGDTFGSGRRYNLALLLGGAKLKPVPRKRSTYQVKIKADLKVSLGTKVLYEQKDLFTLDRQLTYKPLRLVLPANWTVPKLPSGLYDLQIVAHDLLDNRVSQFIRRVEVVGH